MFNKKSIAIALGAALALGASGAALATPVTVDGVTWDTANPLNFQINTLNMRETAVTATGQTLTGYGQVGSINGNNNFCSGCDLTFTYTYTLSNITGNQVVFDKGSINFFVSNSPSSFNVQQPDTATIGTPWLTLTGHTAPATTFAAVGQLYGTIVGSLSNPTQGSNGFGYLDVSGGPAATYLDMYQNVNPITHAIGPGNFGFNSSFLFDGTNICGSLTSGGTSMCFPIGGTAELYGRLPKTVPEPGEIGLMGLGLGILGLFFWWRRKEGETRA
ncbi:MAG: PEP-CTERM sorting domain-containing protein [Burkholderiales bacterium]